MPLPGLKRALGVFGLLAAAGCHSGPPMLPPDCNVPRELNMSTQPEYVVEPPDVLQIDATRVVPLPPYKVDVLEVLLIRGTPDSILPGEPLDGPFAVDPDGTINLGGSYGTVKVLGLTLPEVKAAIEKQIKEATGLKKPVVTVALGQSKALQQVRGEHLVRPDGTIGLGTYGSLRVVGLTMREVKQALEAHLTQYLQNPEVSVDVLAYNSKFYYVIFDGAGFGQQVQKLPITGNERVLDAVANLNGLTQVSSKHKIWVARPTGGAQEAVMGVDWEGITERAQVATNYQLMPGDRLFVQSNHLVKISNYISFLVGPAERVFGFALLGNNAIQNIKNPNRGFGNNNGFIP